MGSAGGMLTRDRIRTVLDAADRLEVLDERVAIMTENEPVTNKIPDTSIPTFPTAVSGGGNIHKVIFDAMNSGTGLPR